MSNEEKAKIILDVIDIKTGFCWNDNDKLWLDAIKLALEEIKKEEIGISLT